MGDMTNWLYDPQGRLHICISGQLSILMLIEELELAGIDCFFSNTDGFAVKVKKTQREEFQKICDNWAALTTYNLEYVEYKRMYFRDVNNYIAETTDGKVKKKGIFLTSTELHKNKSFRVIAMALEQYFINGIKPEDYIPFYQNVYDFCGRSTAPKKTFEHVDLKTKKKLPHLIRYYVTENSNPDGSKPIKMVKATAKTKAKSTLVEPADYLKILCNYLPPSDFSHHLSQINHQWYIDECYKVILPIEAGRKIKFQPPPKNQLSLF